MGPWGLACRVLACSPDRVDAEVIGEAASVIRRGGLVAFPTETVYGLGADAFNGEAVRRVFTVKGRPPDNPVIVHLASPEDLWLVASSVPEEAWRLVERAWPGPLTIVVPRDPQVPSVVSGGLDTVAVRMPAHPVALSLIKAAGTPVAAPSANISGRPSPVTAEHVVRDLCDRIDVVIDGGETFMGVESTVVDFTRDPPVLLRPGPYPVEVIEKILGGRVVVTNQARGLVVADKPLAPGMKYRHYSPDTPLILVESADEASLARAVEEEAARILARGGRVAVIASEETRHLYSGLEARGAIVVTLGSRRDLPGVARRLYHALRRVDEMGVDAAIVEGYPEEGVGLAVMNRLRKAAVKRVTA
jgi:L-threonylcarbamoyladenylate synthase